LEVDFVNLSTFDHAVMMEWLNDGQHVTTVSVGGVGWQGMEDFDGGHVIGHKQIEKLSSNHGYPSALEHSFFFGRKRTFANSSCIT